MSIGRAKKRIANLDRRNISSSWRRQETGIIVSMPRFSVQQLSFARAPWRRKYTGVPINFMIIP
jgi:hypothetical protein